MLCDIDIEATSLDRRLAQPYEICVWREDASEPTTFDLPHTLEHADPKSLEISRYYERGFRPWATPGGPLPKMSRLGELLELLRGVTLVGSNPSYDAEIIRNRILGYEPWNHRMVDVSDGAMWVFGWAEPRGLAGAVTALRAVGHEIPDLDHTALGDVRVTRAVRNALRTERIQSARDIIRELDPPARTQGA